MNNLNSILVEGNLTKDPSLKNIPSGNHVCLISVATNRYWKQDEERQQEVSYFDVEAWATLGERCHHYLKKGSGVRVVGRLKQDRWSDADGKQHSRVKIIAEHVEFRGNPAAGSNGKRQQLHTDSAAGESMAAESPF